MNFVFYIYNENDFVFDRFCQVIFLYILLIVFGSECVPEFYERLRMIWYYICGYVCSEKRNC